ncbi:MAG: creatininase family protein [Caldilineaceae bacterium]
MRYGDLTYEEIRDKSAAGWLALVPTGCTEQQGPHLPVDFDTWFAETIMLAAADYAAKAYGVYALVLPALPFGPTPEHRNFGSGYIDLPVSLHHAVVEAVLDSLAAQGFQRIVLWRGCGGHELSEVLHRFTERHSGRSQAFQPDWPYQQIWCRIGDSTVPSGHADSFATALALYLRPASVRMDKIRNPGNAPVDWADPQLDFARYSTTGVIGDPTYATADLGKRLWDDLVETVAQMLCDLAEESIAHETAENDATTHLATG